VEDWVAELERGRFDAAWDLFLDRYRRLIFAAIRHYAQDYDDVMDVFARACEALRADDLRRLRSWSSSRAANTTLGRCRMRARSLILLPLLLVACERQPAAPDRALRPEFAAIHSEITDFFEEVDGPADCTANPKIGEIVLFTGRINYVLRATTTPSGKVDTTLKFFYDPAVRLVGQTSGTVWMINPTNTQPIALFLIHGNGAVNKINEHEFYTNAAGGHLLLVVNFQVTVNAHGDVKVSRDFVYRCIGG